MEIKMSNRKFVEMYTKEERKAHIDLSQPCEFYYLTRNSPRAKKGDIASNNILREHARKNTQELMIEIFDDVEYENLQGRSQHSCHLCPNHSVSDTPCTNPHHIYIGTPSENAFDKPANVRSKAASIGGQVAGRSKNNCMNKRVQCPHCGKIGTLRPMKRWHFDNCKHHPHLQEDQ